MQCLYILIGFLSFSRTRAWLSLEDFPSGYAFDRDLHERVLDPELCEQQLEYLLLNNTLLLFQFLDAGPRLPKGIWTGNFKSLGNFHQCLAISSEIDTMPINGKYCTINVPINQNFSLISSTSLPEQWTSGWKMYGESLLSNKHLLRDYEAKKSSLRRYLIFGPDMDGSTRMGNYPELEGIEYTIALCIPKVCTVDEAVNHVLNFSRIKYRSNQCRIPDDKHWIPGDYVAISIFSVLGCLILTSTCYDVHHLFYLKRSPKAMNPLRMFSAYTNMIVLLDTSSKPGTLQCLDGIRAMAMFWVILGHTFYYIPFVGANFLDIDEWQNSLKSIWITGALHTVDTFFMLSGLLLVYINVTKYKSGVGLIKNLHVFYLNRLLRMFPILATMVLFEATFLNKLADGPFWEIVGASIHRCRAFWWVTLLHLQNILTPHDTCIGVSWYLAIDVHLHIISPLVLFWLLGGKKSTSWGSLVIATLMALTTAVCFVFLGDINDDFYALYYVNILTRSPPFFVGMIVGYCLRMYRDKEFKMSPVISGMITIVCMGMTFVVMYLNFLKGLSDWTNDILRNLIDALSRSVWSASLGWIIFVCVNGHGGPINYILSLNIWKIPSRISYAMYLIHFSIMQAFYSSQLQPVYFAVGDALFKFCAFFVLTIVSALLVTGLIDLPFSMIFKIILEGAPKKPTAKPGMEEKTENNNNIVRNECSNKVFDADENVKQKSEL